MFKIIYIISAIVYLVLSAPMMLLNAQGFGYRPPFKAVKCLFLCLIGVVLFLLTVFIKDYGYLISACVLIFLAVYEIITYAKKRVKFRCTARGLRLAFTYFLVVCVLLVAFMQGAVLVAFGGYVILFLVNVPLSKIEHKRNIKYATRALAPLQESSDVIRIVITGSGGKTSVKNILATFLSSKYEVIYARSNYNTPLGIAKTVEDNINAIKNPQKPTVFIAEAGARRKGDIREICTLIKPSYGIITSISAQHLATFKTLKNVINTKGELADYLESVNGFTVFNGQNAHVEKIAQRYRGDKAVLGRDVEILGLMSDENGSAFTLKIQERKMPIRTPLLGSVNALNIALSASLAVSLGIELEDIARLSALLKPSHHRLEMIKSGSLTIIDDSYNGNIDGVKSAIEVVSTFKNRKVIYSQGVVEGGRAQKRINEEIGMCIAKVADVVILGGLNAKHIEKGLKKGGFKGAIYTFSSLKEAESNFKNILLANDVLLIQNDVP